MKPARSVNHIGVAVKSIAEQREFYERTLGAEFEGMEDVPTQRVRVCFLRFGDVKIELLEPTDATSPISAFLEKRGEGLHHVAYTVDDIPARLAELKAEGVRLIDEAPRPGAHGTQVAFLHPKSTHGVLTELCEPAKEHK